MTGRRRTVRVTVGVAVLLAVAVWAGPGAFLEGVRALGPASLALTGALTAVAVLACGWRWYLVARALGVALTPGAAVLGCYRAQALNLTVPGGVVGDVHRGVRLGRAHGQTALALRSVAWERAAGQAVQLGLLLAVLVALPGTLPGSGVPGTVLASVLLAAGVAGALVASRGGGAGRLVRLVGDDLRRGVAPRTVWPWLLLTSLVASATHLATFVVAARATGVAAPLSVLLPLAVVVLTVAGLPVNVAGWGPREGAAAWAFAAAGLGAQAGAAAATAYGCLALAAHLPGVVLLLAPGRAPAGRVPPVTGRQHA